MVAQARVDQGSSRFGEVNAYAGSSKVILYEHGLDYLACHAGPNVEADGQIAQELPFPGVDLSVREQKIGDESERRRSQRRRDPPGGGLRHGRGFLLFEQLLHAIDEPADRLA